MSHPESSPYLREELCDGKMTRFSMWIRICECAMCMHLNINSNLRVRILLQGVKIQSETSREQNRVLWKMIIEFNRPIECKLVTRASHDR